MTTTTAVSHRTDEDVLLRDWIPFLEAVAFAYFLVLEHRLPEPSIILFGCPLVAFLCFVLAKSLVWTLCALYTYIRGDTPNECTVITT